MRLLEATPGSHYVLEFCVATTATYGDKFRPVGGCASRGGHCLRIRCNGCAGCNGCCSNA